MQPESSPAQELIEKVTSVLKDDEELRDEDPEDRKITGHGTLLFRREGEGGLGGRNFAQQTAFTLSSSFNAHKLLPERFGWSIPLSYSLTQNGSTPRFDPDNGDVRLDDLVQQAREAEVVEGSTALPPDLRADAILERARTQTASQSVRVQVSKNGSRSPWLRYTVDGLSASYSRSMQSSTNPSSSLNESDGWTGTLNYRVTVPDPLAVKPFWFTRSVPLLGRAIGGLRLNLLPSFKKAPKDEL